ncbi:cupin domain-containing protein [Cetobacterium sp. 2G large]|uniref:cupin domain-containing protein n=1 Tax=Cetobacterium sp. 2G large TaxID=2759680 RepID=UPI00163BF12A|nr:cupin domain-containing protein [Cetobacterium sp. 2G large]MBC2852483.1 cupin domain-containing protein [Cetobacterium sp. 2G large]
MEKFFFKKENIEYEELGLGVKRKILAHDKNLMIVEVHFDKGSEGAIHTHKHEQITYVLEGKFLFTVGEKIEEVKKGDSIYMPKNISHGAKCVEKGVLLDIFTPQREDFLN